VLGAGAKLWATLGDTCAAALVQCARSGLEHHAVFKFEDFVSFFLQKKVECCSSKRVRRGERARQRLFHTLAHTTQAALIGTVLESMSDTPSIVRLWDAAAAPFVLLAKAHPNTKKVFSTVVASFVIPALAALARHGLQVRTIALT
jgi:hypothetical protein